MNCVIRFAVVMLVVCGCSSPPTPIATPVDKPPEHPGIQNLHVVGESLWSGSVPAGDEGFQTLHDLGVKTIVSVDGAKPDVERAKRFGLRYVHLPVGYGGITREQELVLARAAELPGPIYVHCHHGQHRGPAAAALMNRCRQSGWTADDAVAFLKVAGTDPKYEGLFAAVRDFRLPTAEQLKDVSTALPEVADIGGLTACMVDIDEAWAMLKRCKGDSWKSAATLESLAHLAVLLHEGFRESQRLPDAASRSEQFRNLLGEAECAAHDLEKALRAGDLGAANKAFDRAAASCTACHREYRDRRP